MPALGRIERDASRARKPACSSATADVNAPLPEGDQARARDRARSLQAFSAVGRQATASGRARRADERRRSRRPAPMLRTAMGPAIAAALADPLVIEVMVNPDGALRLDRLGRAAATPARALDRAQVERIIRLVASHARTEVHAERADRQRRAAAARRRARRRAVRGHCCRRSSPRPCFSIRKPAARIYTLADYVRDGIMTRRGGAAAVAWRSPSAATSWSPAAPARARRRSPTRCSPRSAHLDERVILIEDTRELQCAAPDTVALRTRPGVGRHGRPRALDAAPPARPDHRRRGARAARRSTCSRPGTPAIPAGSPRSTPTARARRSTGSSS